MVHALHALTLLVVLKVDAGQAVQVRSLVALPALLTKVPAEQLLLLTQAVVELLSLSQVVPPQLTLLAIPPAQ